VSIRAKLIIVSVAIGIAASLSWSLGAGFAYGPFGARTAVPMMISIGFSVTWAVRFVFVLVQHGKQGLWFLVGAPLGVLWPLLVFAFWWPCAAHWQCL